MKPRYDFRSDTVTQPTQAMRDAMATAEVGDDVYEEDPTVIRLEQAAAHLMGKESGLFVTSGTMGNLLAVLARCGRGDEAIMGTEGHTMLHEAGGVSALGGVVIHTIPNQLDGTLALADLQRALRSADDIHEPHSRMVILENTQNACGGLPLSVDYTAQVGRFCQQNGLNLPLDGARIFNAAIALGVKAERLAAPADSVTFCLSKGLCAPVGSVLCGERDFIKQARRLRKMLGGGMRQAGVLAAAGLVALQTMIDRLSEDHRRARQLGEALRAIPGVSLIKNSPATNMVFIHLAEDLPYDNAGFIKALAEEGVLIGDTAPREFRLVTHHDLDDEAMEYCAAAIRRILEK